MDSREAETCEYAWNDLFIEVVHFLSKYIPVKDNLQGAAFHFAC